MKPTKEAILAIIVALSLLILASCLSSSVQNSNTAEPDPPLRVESVPPPSSNAPSSSMDESAALNEVENYQGLTIKEWDDLQGQKAEYEALPDDEKQKYHVINEISCEKYIHLGWEHYIDNTLIQHVGSEQFESWITEQQSNDQCIDIYSFADYFSIDLETLTSLIRDNNLGEVYPIDKLEARYTFMSEKETS
jgi:hypothetical protein